MRVVVIGGGVAGAASAIALCRIGADVAVFEAYPDPAGAYGSFVSLAGNGLRALDSLGCLNEVQGAGFDVARQRMWSAKGKSLGDVPRGRRADDPRLSVTLMRRDLVSVLRAEAVRSGAEIVLDDRVESIDDPRVAAADLIVGADGIWSSMRKVIDPDGPEPRFAGLYTVSGIADAGDLPRGADGLEPGAFNMIFGRHGSFIHLTAPNRTIWWSAQMSAAVAPDPKSVSLADVARLLDDAPRAAAIVRATIGGHTATLNHVLPPVPRQHTERLVLVGDAAHPVGAGQGASMAIEDAIVLGQQLHRADSVSVGLASFDNLRRGRLDKMTKSASANRDAKTAGPLASRMRDLIMPITFNRFYERATGWLYDYDPGTLPAATERA